MNSTPAPLVLAPNVYLFAYQLCQKGKDHLFWTECDRLLEPFGVSLKDEQEEIEFNSSALVSGSAQAWQLKDSYCLFFNLGYEDDRENLEKVSLDELGKILKPNAILHHFTNPGKKTFFLGNTLILTAYIPSPNKQRDPDYLQSLANSCFTGLFDPDELQLYESGELFGNSIFAYDNRDKTGGDRHVLIWLFRDEQAHDAVNQCLPLLTDLLFYRTKIVKAFADSREIYQGLKQGYGNIEETLDDLQIKLDNRQSNDLTKDDLADFKGQLKNLTKESLPYRRFLRKMDDFGNTIQTNLKNYDYKLDEIAQTLNLAPEKLGLFYEFAQETAPYYHAQIQTNLSYFADGTELVDQAIATIRGLVEIEQAESDRILQQQNEALQNEIQAIGVGIAAGAIVASTSGLMTEPWDFQNLKQLEWQFPLPFLVALVGSFLCSFSAWKLARRWIKHQRN
ncbi:hypothetical protein PMG71_17770 [Roseofilum sp. BLCC_M154]|uniref:Uncharacterized protein n=1 Tax=Roseofilum acuticapitatum BLCC-M154 TaxID=3022444 RepID=A0ABT7AWL5_9CYAN|nr:hypothetical protein [Roseofilum acuticapitatum]MDJ1171280.1 hypothetical protein [Roseofilum acuticapitatum BLCC-M154]